MTDYAVIAGYGTTNGVDCRDDFIDGKIALSHKYDSPSVVNAIAQSDDYIAIGGSRLEIINKSDLSLTSGIPTISGVINGLDFSPDGSLLAVAHTLGNRVTVLNTSNWESIGLSGVTQAANSVKFSPDGNFLASAHSQAPLLQVRNMTTQEFVSVPSVSGTCNDVDFSHSGDFLAVVYNNSPRLTVINTSDWTAVSGTPTIPGASYSCKFSPSDNTLTIGHTTAPRLTVINTSDWTAVSGTPTISAIVNHVHYSQNGDHLLIFTAAAPFFGVLNTSNWSVVPTTVALPAAGTSGITINKSEIRKVSGIIYDSDGAPASRKVSVFDRDDITNSVTINSNMDGSYTQYILADYEVCRIAFSDDDAEGDIYNDVVDRIIPG